MEGGHNWSGNERNVAFLNTRDGRFAGVSALTGFDSPADGRGMAMVDWDNDGDQDIWITQRTAPRLRFLRNDNHSGAKSLGIRLQQPNGNLHGIGARVEVTESNGHRQIRTLRAGEGYLSQSSQTLHFGLGTTGSVSTIKVRWPNGQINSWQTPPQTPLIRLTQNDRPVAALHADRRGLQILAGEAPVLHVPKVNRIIPHSPLPLPPVSYADMQGETKQLQASDRRRLIVLWATWCLPCIQELNQLNEHQEALKQQGLDVIILNLDDMNQETEQRLSTIQRMQRRQRWSLEAGLATTSLMEIADAAREAILGRQWTWSIPCSMLLDEKNRLLAFYEGSPNLDMLRADTQSLFQQGHDRIHAVPYAGKWYVEPYPPDHLALATILKDKGRYSELMDYLKQRSWRTPSEKELASKLSREAGVDAAGKDAFIAETLLNEAIRLMPNNSEHQYIRAMFHQSAGRFAAAISDYEKVLTMERDHLKATAALAWLLATSPDPTLHRPSVAIELALKACASTHNQAPETLDILAAAYARNGQFEHALETATKALNLIAEDSNARTTVQNRINLYRQKTPFKLPPP